MSALTCVSPVDNTIFASRETVTAQEARNMIAHAKSAGKTWSQRPLNERVEIVMAAIKRLALEKEEAGIEIAHMMGRPVHQFFEFNGCLERASYMALIAEEALAPIIIEDSAQFERRIEKEPCGLVFIVAPWNYPYLTTINSLVPALIAGNSVLMKHASQTLLVGERLERVFKEAGLPEGVLQNIHLDHETSSALIGEGHFGFVNFTGSVGGGKAMEQASAGTFTPVGTELGGKDPAYVMEDADLDVAVASLMDGAFFNAGQCCCGIERIYVHEALFEAFVEKSVTEILRLKLGNPFDASTTIGPMAHRRFADEIRGQTSEAVEAGAQLLIPASAFPEDDGGAYLAPQLLTDVTHAMRIMRDESFGPVVAVMKVSSDEEAVALMNDSHFGLTASLWGQDAQRVARLGKLLETGTVFMNRCDYLDPAICWTGCKDTGHGVTLSILGYNALTRPKSYHLRKG
ncbi:aldehyde dehydrogenase family protein [Paenochrobactrum sp. BZR 588]|uniref:aldehyde dehydrogenase family protein n=1 Tax=unclassified Paenochrobactrum TaxID=2639760 RepID=UPI0038518877